MVTIMQVQPITSENFNSPIIETEKWIFFQYIKVAEIKEIISKVNTALMKNKIKIEHLFSALK